MPQHVEVSREISAPAEQVWAMVTDVSRMSEWSPETVAIRWLKGATSAAPGAAFSGTNRNGSKQWKTVSTVVEAEPGKVFRFGVKAVGLNVAEWAYTFEPTADGCRVTESWTDRRGPVLKVLSKQASGVSDRATHNRDGMTETLRRLAAAAEATTS